MNKNETSAGNAAKLREALMAIKEVNDTRPHDAKGYEINDIITEALAAPDRNCDVGTPKEQEERFKAFCASHWNLNNTDGECAGCPLNERTGAECEFAWAQMPYKEGGEK